MRDMSVSSSTQFAGIHTQPDRPPRLALSLSSFLTWLAAETRVRGCFLFFLLSNYSDQGKKKKKHKVQTDNPQLQRPLTGTSKSCEQLPAQQLREESDPAN